MKENPAIDDENNSENCNIAASIPSDCTPERFVFSFYVKINREISEEENLIFIKSQLESLEEIENLSSLYFRRYFNRLLFNEIVIDFLSKDTEVWRKEPKTILRKTTCYNDAYKFSQLNVNSMP